MLRMSLAILRSLLKLQRMFHSLNINEDCDDDKYRLFEEILLEAGEDKKRLKIQAFFPGISI